MCFSSSDENVGIDCSFTPPGFMEHSRGGRRGRNGQECSLQGTGESVGEGHVNKSPSWAMWLNLLVGRGGAGWDWTIVEAGVGGGVRVDPRRFLVAL